MDSTGISVKNVSKLFGAKKALNNVSLDVPEGHIFGLLGPNGAGKTTLIRCIMDYISPTSGEIKILSKDSHKDGANLKNLIGYLSSDMQLRPNWDSRTHIDFLSKIKGRGRADELVKKLDLNLDIKVQDLSSGNKQKLAIILAFLGKPKLLIMDEPTRGLDPLLQNLLYRLLQDFADEGGTVFLSSHNLAEVQRLCTSVAVIRQGEVVAKKGMDDILQLGVHIVQVVANKPINHADFKLKGVQIISGTGPDLTLKVLGNIDPVIKVLTKYSLVNLEINHASLEDAFMEYYSE